MVTTRHHPQEFPPPAASTSTSKQALSKREHSPASPGHWAHIPSSLVMLWLLGSIPLVIWDTGYVLLRPHSMPGGALHKIWSPYALYGTVDYIYGWPAFRAQNGFTAAQASLNVVETICYLFYLSIVWTHGKAIGARGKPRTPERGMNWFLFERKYVDGRMGAIALLVVFSASVMTLSKTVLYGLNEVFSGFNNVGHNDLSVLVFLWIVPNLQFTRNDLALGNKVSDIPSSGLWIVFPSVATVLLGLEIIDALETASGVSRSARDNNPKPKAT
ncbi:hypothetical protein PRK78_000726 [Emydomyces testavorans]|uniref:C6 transcription factor n=1 Tax=Emydomyces testavorans TaxID=2070801 RepID=A0AAF0DD16_9EURO|nr:hypothetical protein PRK78_000726 [Emydomyces testavorans]